MDSHLPHPQGQSPSLFGTGTRYIISIERYYRTICRPWWRWGIYLNGKTSEEIIKATIGKVALAQLLIDLAKTESANLDTIVTLLEKTIDAKQIIQWLQDGINLDEIAILLGQGIESPVVTQLINNQADLEDIATNAQHLLNGRIRIELINIWLKNGTHLNNAIAIMRMGVDLNRIGTSSKVGEFTGLTGASPDEIVSRIPMDAKILAWKPEIGTVDKGMKFGWTDTEKQKWEVRMHELDPKAPAGSHAASGWVLRVRHGKEYMDPSGTFYKQHVLYNQNSPYYNPKAANDTHIPIQTPSTSF